MKRPIRSLHGLGLTTTLCLVIVLSTLLANSAIEPSVAHAQGYVVDISLGKNPVPSGTGTSVKVSIHDDYISDTYSSSATGFALKAWVYRNDSVLTNMPSCHGSGWPSSRSITPVSDGHRMVINFRVSGSCPIGEEPRYSIRADVIARIDGTDTVVANRAFDFTVEGVPPTVTPTATRTPARSPIMTHTPSPTATEPPIENPAPTATRTATPAPTATRTPGNAVVSPPVQPTETPISKPASSPTPTPTQVQPLTLPDSGTQSPVPVFLPTDVPLELTVEPPVSTPVPETIKPVPPPPSTCIVAHAAAPVQVCRDNDSGALHFHFVGPKDVFSGPMFPSVADLISAYPLGYLPSAVELYNGTSTGTGKKVIVRFLTEDGRLLISTYYADTSYTVDKPYIFTIDQYGTVTHLAW